METLDLELKMKYTLGDKEEPALALESAPEPWVWWHGTYWLEFQGYWYQWGALRHLQ
jgi:hypothetical protein